MAGHAAFGNFVHFSGANLHLYGQAVRAYQSGVYALITIVFGNGDVVFDFARLGLVNAVQSAQCGIASGNVIHNHAEAVNVHHFSKAQILLHHFAVDAEQVLFAPFDLCLNIKGHQTLAECGQDLADHIATVATRCF